MAALENWLIAALAELGVEVATLQREFLHGVRRWNNRGIGQRIVAAVKLNVVVDPVQPEVVLPDIPTIDRIVSALRTARIGRHASGRSGCNTGGHLPERTPVSSCKRQII